MKISFSPLGKALCLASGLSLISGAVSFIVQTRANRQVSSCSYLDPVIVDILAAAIAVFLFTEGLVSIFKHKEGRLVSQFSRCLRMAIGTGIMTIHVLQFIHK